MTLIDPSYCSDDLGETWDRLGFPRGIDSQPVAGDCASNPDLVGTGDCSGSLGTTLGLILYDYSELTVGLQVPDGARSIHYDFAFLSREYPDADVEFGDTFFAWLESERWTGNTALGPGGTAMSVFSADFDVRDDDGNAVEFDGTCMWGSAATDWRGVMAPVVEGEFVQLSFGIFDAGDSVFDSFAFIDNVGWGCEELTEPRSL